MMISSKGRYALRVMTDLASMEEGSLTPLKEIARRQDISEKYLEAIFKGLVQEGLVVGTRGKGGGYRLARSAESYTIREILEAAEGSLAPVSCVAPGVTHCARPDQCGNLPLWKGLERVICDYFSGITLSQLTEQAKERGMAAKEI